MVGKPIPSLQHQIQAEIEVRLMNAPLYSPVRSIHETQLSG